MDWVPVSVHTGVRLCCVMSSGLCCVCSPWARKAVVMVLATVGRGGDGNQGQRIRDEILSIQSRNGSKGGMTVSLTVLLFTSGV